MMTQHILPIVGAHFRPPAKSILSVLPSNAPLLLRPEPDNPFDANAVQVLVASATIPSRVHEDLRASAEPYGYSLESILAEPRWHLGYIPKEHAALLVGAIAQWITQHDTDEEVPGILLFSSAGKPTVQFAVE